MDEALATPTLSDFRAAQQALSPIIAKTPLLRFAAEDSSACIYLKLESLQPIGAFKIRCMANALLCAGEQALHQGVYTASSGNAGIGLAWAAREFGIKATVYTPEFGPRGKLDIMRNYGADIVPISNDDWWQVILNGCHPSDPGWYVDAVRNPAAMAGNGTIGLEILEQLPELTSVVVPFGGGGLSCGMAAAIKSLRPEVNIVVAECDRAAPVSAAFANGRPVSIEMKSSFISGAGAPCVLDEMWPLVRRLVDDTVVVSESDVANAVRLLFERNRLVAEGAGALSVAAALSRDKTKGNVVCVVSGGNIEAAVMAKILLNQDP